MEDKKPLVRTKESSGAEGGNEEDDLVFPGFRFHPTDQELIGFYLKRRVENRGFSIDIIKEIDIYKHDPWDLPSEARHVVQGAGEKDWHFFCLRGRKYRNSIRPNRVTGSGFWKATGIDKAIHDGGGECIGLKKSLVYYRGSAGRGTKTDWMMHEFRLPSTSSSSDFQDAEIWTICRIFKRNMSYNRRYQQPKQEQEGNNTRSHHNHHHHHQQQQLNYYYGYQHHHQHNHTSCGTSMASSFESTTDTSKAHAPDHDQLPFMLHGFHGALPADVTATKMSATIGSSPLLSSSVSGWRELTSFVRDGGSSWDELGRILEISTDMAYL